jgi:2,4-dichlorophenol 6-monooxygenase
MILDSRHFFSIGACSDPYGDWARLREVADGGALLVRPDGYVAFRHATAAESDEDAERVLTEAVRRILGHA